MLTELSMVEQRYLAVREVLDTGASVTDVAARYGVDRRTLHRWLTRYANDGLGALADRSWRPGHCPHQLAPVIEAQIIEMRARPSALGAADDPRQAAQGVRRGAFTLWHLPLPGAPPSHRAQGPSPPAQRLQTLGTIPLDGALADGRGGPDLSF